MWLSLPKLGCSQTKLIFSPTTLKSVGETQGPEDKQLGTDGGGGLDFVTGVPDPGGSRGITSIIFHGAFFSFSL